MSALSRPRTRRLGVAVLAAAGSVVIGLASGGPPAADGHKSRASSAAGGGAAEIEMLAPENGDRAGLGSRGWFVDLEVEFDVPLERTGFMGLQLTGPGAHNDTAPFPGTFSMGRDDRFRGLIVLVKTNQAGAGKNVANLFNLMGVTDRDRDSAEIWDTWIVGAPNFGRNVDSTVYAAIAADRNGNGVFDDAPDEVADQDGDGDVDRRDLKAFGVASNIEEADFVIRD